MIVFLWNQRERRVESRELLTQAIRQYQMLKQNTGDNRESGKDSLFEFALEIGELKLVEMPGGKPCAVDSFGNRLPLEASVTHTGDWWLCAVGEHPVGIDAELRSRKVDPRLIRRICTADERSWLERAKRLRPEGENERLLWLWVRKEAYVKYLGTGIGEGLNSFSVFEKDRAGSGNQDSAYQTVNLRCIADAWCASEEAAFGMIAAVYCPEEKIEGYQWISM